MAPKKHFLHTLGRAGVLLVATHSLSAAWAASENFFPQQRPVLSEKAVLAKKIRLALLSEAPPADPSRPIENIVSPEHLFPMEGTTFKEHSTGEDLAYRALDAFDSPDGTKVGTVELTDPACFEATEKQATCANAGIAYFADQAGQEHALATEEWSDETRGLISYSPPQRMANGKNWYRIEYRGGSFWVTTNEAFVFNVDDLAHMVDPVDLWCSAPGQCTALSASMRKSLEAIATGKMPVLGCYPEAYEVKEVVKFQGHKYYKVSRVEFAPFVPASTLPATGFIPVRTLKGAHTGSYYARGC